MCILNFVSLNVFRLKLLPSKLFLDFFSLQHYSLELHFFSVLIGKFSTDHERCYVCAFTINRTDNAIKNHWNSSVKKKLDSYLASGLLSQLQDPISVGQPNQLLASSSKVLGSGNDSGSYGMETEEISECSQDATVADSFMIDSACETLHMRKEVQLIEDLGLGKEQSSSPISCSEPYYHHHPAMEEITCPIAEFDQEVGHCLSPSEKNPSHDCRTTSNREYQCHLNEFPNISSLQLDKAPQFEAIGTGMGESHGAGSSAQNPSMVKGATASVQIECRFISDDEFCRVLFSDSKSDQCNLSINLRKGSYVPEMCDFEVPVQSLGTRKVENNHPSASQVYDYPPGSDVQEKNLLPQSCMHIPSVVSVNNEMILLGGTGSNKLFVGAREHECVTSQENGFVYDGGTSRPSCFHVTDDPEMQEQSTGTCSHERPKPHNENLDSGVLCYEPPRFPSLDVPFFNCDLIQAGSEMQYSPLGIRQLMMSSLNGVTPFRLWDSPSHDTSPDAVLKNAAETFSSTPSILKKRHRDFLSPLSDRRIDKKLETVVTSRLTENFSRLDVVFKDGPESTEDKENMHCTFEKKQGTADVEICVQSTAEIVSHISAIFLKDDYFNYIEQSIKFTSGRWLLESWLNMMPMICYSILLIKTLSVQVQELRNDTLLRIYMDLAALLITARIIQKAIRSHQRVNSRSFYRLLLRRRMMIVRRLPTPELLHCKIHPPPYL